MTKRDVQLQKRLDQAIEAFSKHELIHAHEDRWLIAQRYEDGKLSSTYLAEIFSGWGGFLYVGGDVDTCVFAYYSDGRGHRDKLAWIGQCQDVSYYVAQKAAIGMTDSRALTEEYSEEAAREDLRWHLAQYDTDAYDDEERERYREVFARAQRQVDDPDRMRQTLVDDLGDSDAWEWAGGIGQVCAGRVIYAWAAVRRLCELLKARDEHGAA